MVYDEFARRSRIADDPEHACPRCGGPMNGEMYGLSGACRWWCLDCGHEAIDPPPPSRLNRPRHFRGACS